jgi:hypothetical protein
VTVTPANAAPELAASIALDAPCTLPVIVAEPATGGFVVVPDGDVGDPVPPPHAPASMVATIASPRPLRMRPPGEVEEQCGCPDGLRT